VTPPWFLIRGGLGRLAAWHLPGGSASKWAASTNVEVNREKGREERERRELGTKSQRGKGRKEWNGEGTLVMDGGLHTWIMDICAGDHRVSSYATADGASVPT